MVVSFSFTGSVWLGSSDETKESDWRWVNNDPLFYTKWQNDEPDGSSSQNCMLMSQDGAWNDESCSSSHGFLCSSPGKLHLHLFFSYIL